MTLFAQIELPGTPAEWVMAGSAFLLIVIVLGFFLSFVIKRFLRRGDSAVADEFAPKSPRSEDAGYAAASMQGVIKRLKEQEKELEKLHRAEKERAQQTERMSEAVTRDMPTGLLLINAAGLITLANPAVKQTLGIESLAYRRFSEALGPETRLTALLQECLGQASTFQREELDHLTPGGVSRHLGVTVSPVFHPPGDPNGKVNGAVCLLSDLTEMADLQRQVRLKENLAALGEMSAGIAHEFKNALATISGYAQLIRNERETKDSSENAEKIIQQTNALAHVVTEFLRFAKPLEVGHDALDLRVILDGVVAQLTSALPSVRFSCKGSFAPCAGDEGLLRQAFSNLARNAAEAIRANSPAIQEVQIEGELVAGRQRISFADSGPGIPEQDLSRIFLPFYTTKAEGTGLGLALVQKIVVHHGGTVEARNRPEGGAEFIVWLPLAGGGQ